MSDPLEVSFRDGLEQGRREAQEREDHILDCYETIKQREAEVERLTHENIMLRAALREIAESTNHTSDYCRDIARAALEGKK